MKLIKTQVSHACGNIFSTSLTLLVFPCCFLVLLRYLASLVSWFAVPMMTLTVSHNLPMLLSKLIMFVAAAAARREYKLSSPTEEVFFHFLFGVLIQKERLLIVVG